MHGWAPPLRVIPGRSSKHPWLPIHGPDRSHVQSWGHIPIRDWLFKPVTSACVIADCVDNRLTARGHKRRSDTLPFDLSMGVRLHLGAYQGYNPMGLSSICEVINQSAWGLINGCSGLLEHDEIDDEEGVRRGTRGFTGITYTPIRPCVYTLQTWLESGDPVGLGLSTTGSWDNWPTPMGGMTVPPKQDEFICDGEAITLIGYDNRKMGFYFRRHTGRDWGMGGYGFLPYAMFSCEWLAMEAIVIHDIIMTEESTNGQARDEKSSDGCGEVGDQPLRVNDVDSGGRASGYDLSDVTGGSAG